MSIFFQFFYGTYYKFKSSYLIYFENYSANNKSNAQKYCTKSVEQTITPCGIVKVAPYPCQGSQLSNRTYKPKEWKTIIKNTTHTNPSLIEDDHIFSEQEQRRYLSKLTSKQKIAVPVKKHPELVTDDGYLDRYFRYPENDSSKVVANNTDSLYDIRKCPNRQCTDIMKSLIISKRRNRSQIQPFAELSKVNYTHEKVETSRNMIPVHHSNYENIKKASDILNMDHRVYSPEKIQGFRKEIYSVSQHPYMLETNNEKKNHSKNMFIFPGKLLRNVGNGLNSERCLPNDTEENLKYLTKPEIKIEQAKSGIQCQQFRMKPNVHLVPIVRKKEQEAIILSQKKMNLRKFPEEESSHESNIFVNPVYADVETGIAVSNRCNQESEIMIPQWEISTSYNAFRDNKRNSTFVSSCLPYPGNSCQPRKALRRFI